MAATAEQIITMRRLIAESTADTYTDQMIVAAIEARPVKDTRGVDWWEWDFTTTPPSQDENPNWIPTYDMNAAAADIWDEKAAAVAGDFGFSADGATYNRQQVFDQYTRIAQKYRSRARLGGMKLVSKTRELRKDGVVLESTNIVDTYDRSDVVNE